MRLDGDRKLAVAMLLLVLPGMAAGCRSMKASLDNEYLIEHKVYRSRAFAREPYLFEVRPDQAEIICRSFDREPPRLLIAPYNDRITQTWDRRLIVPDETESKRLHAAELPARLPLWQHRVVIGGLQARGTYSALVAPNDAASAEDEVELRFTTLPVLGGPANVLGGVLRDETVSFLVIGNTGTGSEEQLTIARRIEQSLEKDSGFAKGVDFIVHTGDLVYEDGAAADYEACVFSPYRKILQRVPMYPVIGDRDAATDGGAPFFAAFPRGDVKQPYYSMDLGLVELVGLDSTDSDAYGGAGKPSDDDLREPGRQQLWLEEVLGRKARAWRFVVMHDPALSGGVEAGAASRSGASASRELRQAVRGAFGSAHFILQGHDPHYERSIPIARDWIEKDGSVDVPSWARGMGLDMSGHARPRRVVLDGRTVAMVQGAGGGTVADTMLARFGWGTAWVLGLPFGSPLWLSYAPVGPDWVNAGKEWVDRAEVCYAVTRFDVRGEELRLRTWRIEPDSGRALLADEVFYRRERRRAVKTAEQRQQDAAAAAAEAAAAAGEKQGGEE